MTKKWRAKRLLQRISLGFLIAILFAVVAHKHLSFHKDTRASVSRGSKYEQTPKQPPTNSTYGPAEKLAELQDTTINESSGLAASRTNPGIYWTHNDSGDGPFIYAFDSRGRKQGVWRVSGAQARDWEDMAAGPGPDRKRHYLYLGDIGDNSGRRSEIIVYRVAEPNISPAATGSSKKKPLETDAAEIIRLRYPDGQHNAEALLVHPVTGTLYIVIKTPLVNPGIYQAPAPLSTNGVTTMSRLGALSVPSFFGVITGGAISPDGKRVALCDYGQAYEMVLPGREAFDSIWKQSLTTIALGERKQGESITYRLDGRALLATSEQLPAPLIQVQRN